MGRTIATYTRDIRMKDNVLYVTIESASLRAELQFGREKIKTIMNEEIGEEYIKEVVIN
jgi:predicted nucleic acid-binding Zn ribbon protein